MDKKLSLKEIQKYLSIQKIEEILTSLLLHGETEKTLQNLEKDPLWKEGKEIYISCSPVETKNHFSNDNWLYYLPQFEALRPKSLTIITSKLNNVSGIKKIETLEKIFIGTEWRNSPCMEEDVKTIQYILHSILELPNIRKITIGSWFSNMGSIANHAEIVNKCLEYVHCYSPAQIDKGKSYYPFSFDLK